MLEFIDYISWVYGDQQPENSYQFVRKQKSKDIEQYPESIIYGFEFWEFYYSCLFTISPFSNAPNFLEYHYDKYEGNKSDFLTFVKWSLSIMEPLKHLDFIAAINANSRTPFIKDLIFEWIEKKKKLETDPVHSSIKKIPRLNKYNKPLLNQVQISILFRVMKDIIQYSEDDDLGIVCDDCYKSTDQKYFWQGKPVKVQFGYCKVQENKERPLWWYNYECFLSKSKKCTIIEAIKIEGKEPFVIANHFGIGVYKLMNGGWPNCEHYSLSLGTFSPCEPTKQNLILNYEGFSDHERGRIKWFFEKYPKQG